MAGFLKGALIQFMETFLVPTPNVILFQYNPDTMTHDWTQPELPKEGIGPNPLAVHGFPGETFSFTIAMDSNDTIAAGKDSTEELAQVSGLYSRLAALEMLQYPVSTGPKGGRAFGLSISPSKIAAKLKRDIPAFQVPTVLFVWGPGRVLPVRVTDLKITEKRYDSLLNPVHADAALTLKVLTPSELQSVNGPLKDIAKSAYTYTLGLRQLLAIANRVNTRESVIGMLA